PSGRHGDRVRAAPSGTRRAPRGTSSRRWCGGAWLSPSASRSAPRALLERQDLAPGQLVVPDRPLRERAPVLSRLLAVVLVLQAVVRHAEEQRDDRVDLALGERKRLDAAVEVGIRLAALVVVVEDVPQRLQRAVVHVGRRDADVAELERLEGT